jgi:hypothetical protein
MVNFEDLFNIQLLHDQLHSYRVQNLTQLHIDPSCQHCYPEIFLEDTSQFDNFWNWFSTEYPASGYSANTQRYLQQLISTRSSQQVLELIEFLVISIRYSVSPGDYTSIRQEIYNVLVLTEGFLKDPFEELYQISETAASIEEPEDPDTVGPEDFEHSDDEDYHLDILFESNYDMANPQQADFQNLTAALTALQAALPNTNNALNNNTNAINNPPRRELRVAELPYFYGGSQDPISWLEEFTKSCNANGINDARKIEVVPAYLKGPAASWWTTNQALPNGNANRIVVWTDGNANNTNFIVNFPAAFRSQTLVEIWTTELERRRQQPGENVDTYAAALQELYRRVEHGAFNFPEAMKARRFVNGLLPDLYVNVKPHNDQTWNGAVDRAKSYELTYQDQVAVSAYMNKYAPVASNAQVNILNDAITNLTQQIGQIMQKLVNQANQVNPTYPVNQNRRVGFRNNATPNFQQGQAQQPSRGVCFSCGQPGHMKRNCPNVISNSQHVTTSNNQPKADVQPSANGQAQVLQQLLAQLQVVNDPAPNDQPLN